MHILDNYTESQVLAIIEVVVNKLAKSFTFGYYDISDIKQEGRIFALEALPTYSHDKGALYTFLYTHVRNRFINLRRDKLFRSKPPCSNCHNCTQTQCEIYDNISECSRYNEWLTLNTSKRDLLTTMEIDDNICENNSYTENPIDYIMKREILEYIDKHLEQHLRKDYLMWREGTKLPKGRVDNIIGEVKRILSFYYKEVQISD